MSMDLLSPWSNEQSFLFEASQKGHISDSLITIYSLPNRPFLWKVPGERKIASAHHNLKIWKHFLHCSLFCYAIVFHGLFYCLQCEVALILNIQSSFCTLKTNKKQKMLTYKSPGHCVSCWTLTAGAGGGLYFLRRNCYSYETIQTCSAEFKAPHLHAV
jgi:hypothetical protein